jgi:hypothetical protein
MKKLIIKRAMTGVSGAPKHELDKAGKASEAVLIEMRVEGKEIQQEQSYIAGDAIYCIYHAASADLIREHAERSNGVATEITEITTLINHNTSMVS